MAEITSSLKEICVFIADYSASLLGCGATTIRIEKNARRMAEALGVIAEMVIMPSHITITVWDSNRDHSYTDTVRKNHLGLNFNINTQLSKLSWDLADAKVTYEEAKIKYAEIIKVGHMNQTVVWLLASAATASFCCLFGGTPIAMLVVLISTLVGYKIKQLMLADGFDARLTFFVCAFVSSVLAAGDHIFGLSTTPDISLGTSVLYLVPGVPYLNSMSDLLDGHYLCFFGRLMDALVLTVCLSLGLCGGLVLMGLSCF
jgi:uncharacterized membrane protein YjjP (DUF1212 family)